MQESFQGIGQLYSEESMKKLLASHVLVVGIGGVGSWAAEALARSGIGVITLVDLDDICVSNINRQIHAAQSTVGKFKVDVMKKRILDINPLCKVHAIEDFFSESTAAAILEAHQYDYVIDAIDGVKSKCLLISETYKRNIPIFVTGGAGGKKDFTQIQVADLNKSFNDKLLARVRKKLKQEFGFHRNKKQPYKIHCVFSPEKQKLPEECGLEQNPKGLNCQNGYGSTVFITGTFGFMAAGHVINELA